MKILNLSSVDDSEIIYKITSFPDGQHQVDIMLVKDDLPFPLLPDERVLINTRFTSFKDLELLACAIASLREFGIKNIEVFFSYFLGARSDRKFEIGGNNYVENVIAPFINVLNLDKVTVLDPHSAVLGLSINNFQAVDNYEFVRFALEDLGYYDSNAGSSLSDTFTVMSPDKGAAAKIQALMTKLKCTNKLIICDKERDVTGKILHSLVPNQYENHKDIVIIDDICDGGATFIGIAERIRLNTWFKGNLYLLVTHGIFSKGFNKLNLYFDKVYSTNSFCNFGDYVHDGQGTIRTNLKQLKVI